VTRTLRTSYLGPSRLPVLLLAGAVAVGGCGHWSPVSDPGAPTTQQRTIPADAAGVELADSGSLVVEEGDSPSLTVTAGSKVISHLTSEVNDGVVVLGAEGVRNLGTVRYHLVLQSLESVRISGSGRATAAGASGEGLDVAIDGSGGIKVGGVDVGRVNVEIGGSGGVGLSGLCDQQTITIDGSGGYTAGGLASKTAQVTIQGSGGARVEVSDQLTVRIEGSGTVTYTGGATVQQDVSGSGRVVRG